MKNRKVFVGHAFTEEYIDDFRDAVNHALAFHDFDPIYADQTIIDGHILNDKILPLIHESNFAIFDMSFRARPNIYLELGWAKGIGKSILLTMRKGKKLPSDLQGYDRLEYESFKKLETQLKENLNSILSFENEVKKVKELSETTQGLSFITSGSELSTSIDIVYGRTKILNKLALISREAESGDIVFGQCKTCAGYTSSLRDEFYAAVGRGVHCQFIIKAYAESDDFVEKLSKLSSVEIRLADETYMRIFGIKDKEFVFMLPTKIDEIGIYINNPDIAKYHYMLFEQFWNNAVKL